ncbi:MAG: hypothetical protein RXO23_05835 [Vulcanisaeta sp.]|jgi:hypothetical protein
MVSDSSREFTVITEFGEASNDPIGAVNVDYAFNDLPFITNKAKAGEVVGRITCNSQ